MSLPIIKTTIFCNKITTNKNIHYYIYIYIYYVYTLYMIIISGHMTLTVVTATTVELLEALEQLHFRIVFVREHLLAEIQLLVALLNETAASCVHRL